ncbi:hypothetical protein DFH08DRAFT_891160 [Mycena albidolilacea]|uniref:Secreted protein n=1 Tax=Mycena albidolilacea TaxID=1033008 RepID=A0AAD7EFH5_9AGAR|nr:hypothetical protein DFH08DRAFT_891160 [Mycena albidolilacea]
MGPGPGLCLLLLRTSALALPLYPEVLIVRHPSARLGRRTPCTAHTRHRPDTRAANERTRVPNASSRMGLVLSDSTRTATSAECSRGGCIVRLEPERTNEPIAAEALQTARPDCRRGILRTETEGCRASWR